MGTMLFAASQPATATIWRLNNSNGGAITPNIAASFPVGTTLQQAHDNTSVLAGDTIHVEQSNTSYGSLTMTKRLTIIGVGYFLSMNGKTQVNTSVGSPVGDITMTASTCAGSTITGLTISGSVTMGTNRLSLIRNYISPGQYYAGVYVGNQTNSSALDSTVIAGNYIDASNYYRYGIQTIPYLNTSSSLTNCIIMNNFISGYYYTILLASQISGMIKNNVLSSATMNVYNMYVVNNISTYAGQNTFNNCLIEYNLGYNANGFQTPAGSGNTFTTGTNLVNTVPGFVGGTTSTDSAYTLISTSPAKGTGKSGDDMGMFGGTLPYKLSGIPTVPNVYSLSIGTVAAGATSISVTVSTKSN